jgi:hypothetical protein
MQVIGDGAAVRCPECKAVKMLAAGVIPDVAQSKLAAASPIELLERLHRGASTADCDLAAAMLCKVLGETDTQDFSRAYRKTVTRVRRGYLNREVVLYGFRQAMDPSAENPGKVFANIINNRLTGEPTISISVQKGGIADDRKKAAVGTNR